MSGEKPLAPPVYEPGDAVRVAAAHPPGHRRTPFYIRGKAGVIERYCGAFPNPEERAYGLMGGPNRHLYRVRFRQSDIWADYPGPPEDTLDLEIYEHWLAPDEGERR